MNLYKQTGKFVQECFLKSSGKKSKYSQRTVFWMKKIYPKADEAMLISAIAHDIERAFRKKELDWIKNSRKGFLDKKHIARHQRKSAQIIADFLARKEADKKLIEKIKSLIRNHEFGGTKEWNVLKDADSISFFENNADHFIDKFSAKVGKHKVAEKFDWMFKRIDSEKAKRITRPWYEKAIKKLDL